MATSLEAWTLCIIIILSHSKRDGNETSKQLAHDNDFRGFGGGPQRLLGAG